MKLTNDANAAALGEKSFGLAKDMTDFIVINLGNWFGKWHLLRRKINLWS